MSYLSKTQALIAISTGMLMACGLTETATPTMTDTSSPYYDRPCPLTQHATYPTDLIADCRCGTNQTPRDGIPLCRRPFDAAKGGLRVGKGPSVATFFNVEYLGGFLNESEGKKGVIYVTYGFGPSTEQSGGVMSIDLATGDRTLITGLAGAESRGEGPTLGSVYDIERRSDGKYVALTSSIDNKAILLYEIDPETGNRTDLELEPCNFKWEDDTFVFDLTLKLERGAFAIDEQDRLYFGYSGAGQGVLRYDLSRPVGTQCEIITNSTDNERLKRGSGPALGGFLRNVFIKDGLIYAVSRATKTMYTVEPETGDRNVIITIKGITPIEQWAAWDKTRNVWWLGGMSNGVSIHAWDPKTNTSALIFKGGVFDFMPLGASGPIQINALNHAPFWAHSNGNLYVAQDGQSIVEFEPSTGNSVILSL